MPTQSAQFKLFLLIWKGKKGRRLRLDRELKAQKFKKHREQKRQHVIKKSSRDPQEKTADSFFFRSSGRRRRSCNRKVDRVCVFT